MKEEKPLSSNFRLYKKERRIIQSLAKRLDISKAEVVRRALGKYADDFNPSVR
jgi:hypothetical protein